MRPQEVYGAVYEDWDAGVGILGYDLRDISENEHSGG